MWANSKDNCLHQDAQGLYCFLPKNHEGNHEPFWRADKGVKGGGLTVMLGEPVKEAYERCRIELSSK